MSGRPPRFNAIPKNYFTVPTYRGPQGPMVPRDCPQPGRSTVRMDLRIEARGSLHVGTGEVNQLQPPDNRLYLEIAWTADGRPCIPGSGIKGPIRMIYEVLTGSCDRGCKPGDRLCAACSLFGTLGYQGRVAFDEATPAKDDPADFGLVKLPTAFPPKKTTGPRFYAGFPKGATQQVYYGVLVEGAVLRGGLTVELATDQELGLLLLAMGADGKLYPKLGGGKHGGLGAVSITPTRVEVLDVGTRYRGGGSKTIDNIEAWTTDLTGKAERALASTQGKTVLSRLRENLRP